MTQVFKKIQPNVANAVDEPREPYALRNNSRPLNKEEEFAEENAVTLQKLKFKRIPPLPGTLGYLLRNFENETVMNYVRNNLEQEKQSKPLVLVRLVELWSALDENSRNRVDVFDYLCREFKIGKQLFWGWFQAGAFDDMEAIVQTSIAESTPEVMARIISNALKKDAKYQKDRELWAKLTGRLKEGGISVKIDNSRNTTVNNEAGSQNIFGNFTNSIRAAEDAERGELAGSIAPLQLEEAKTENIIDAEWSDTNERELEAVPINTRAS